jgi:photosystem II stability/assembly factor-like uncharacterized protein
MLIPVLFLYVIPGNSQDFVTVNSYTFGAIEARHIGPARMSGRVTSLDALFEDYRLVYVGTAGGGIWKSTNAGVTFKPVFDDHQQCVGAITIDQNKPEVVWAGTGEPWTRNSVSVGDGIYKTTDGGETWKNMGLEKTERIGRIQIHPANSDIVYVAALGCLWNANEERGVYKTTDGGETWEKILYIDENTGCSDIAIDPEEPDILYAAMWDYRRQPFTFRSGGPGSGLYKTKNGGKSWKRLKKDLPTDTLGRISVDISPADPNIVYAVIECDTTGLYRSMDKGKSWERMAKGSTVGERPFYFNYILADPNNPDKIFKPGLQLNISIDGGKNFERSSGFHSDVHAIWVSKRDTNFIYLGTDGGVYISHDLGGTWRIMRNLPVSQFYHVSADNQIPYNVYGGLQDNGSWMGPSSASGGVKNGDWDNVGGGDGFYVFPDKLDNNIIYYQSQGGNMQRLYLNTRETKNIRPEKDDESEDLRFNWNTPVSFSQDGKTMYAGAQYLFRSYDRGDTWVRISPDLTTDDPEKQKQKESGGVTIDNTGAENHCTIITIHESPVDNQVIWVGTDDGNLQLTTDGGENWENLISNIPGLPENTWCSYVYADPVDKNSALVTFDGHRNGDMKPYVYMTEDLGKTWRSIVDENIEGYCHVIQSTVENPDLLFLGTETGLFISIDKGKVWSRFTGNMPNVAVRDMYIHPKSNDLIIATHGRGIIIIDDITPLQSLKHEMVEEDVVFLPSRPFTVRSFGYRQEYGGSDEFIGQNPGQSGIISYYLKKRHIFGDMYIEVLDQQGSLINTLVAGKRKGINRVDLSVRKKAPPVGVSQSRSFRSFGAMSGPALPAGEYTIAIVKNGEQTTGTFTLLDDPYSPHTPDARKLQRQTANQAYNLLFDLDFLNNQIVKLVKDAEEVSKNTNDTSLVSLTDALIKKAESIQDSLFVPVEGESFTGEKRIRERLVEVYSDVNSYMGKPTAFQVKEVETLDTELRACGGMLANMLENELPDLNNALEETGIKPLGLMTREEYDKENK